MPATSGPDPVIRTPGQRLRVFVSSTLGELAAERQSVREAFTRLRLVPVMFELDATLIVYASAASAWPAFAEDER